MGAKKSPSIQLQTSSPKLAAQPAISCTYTSYLAPRGWAAGLETFFPFGSFGPRCGIWAPSAGWMAHCAASCTASCTASCAARCAPLPAAPPATHPTAQTNFRKLMKVPQHSKKSKYFNRAKDAAPEDSQRRSFFPQKTTVWVDKAKLHVRCMCEEVGYEKNFPAMADVGITGRSAGPARD